MPHTSVTFHDMGIETKCTLENCLHEFQHGYSLPKGALTTLQREETTAQLLGVCYGAKLVRGAYLERERQVAPHLVCDTYDATSHNYNT